ncbi:MAG: biotin--[acetyl-CoA-carboxylase] ligase [Myxococcales bacterium]|nr:biotin--[acetyl-CoA-carboxylase] ligase [Myxococcales bacterium]
MLEPIPPDPVDEVLLIAALRCSGQPWSKVRVSSVTDSTQSQLRADFAHQPPTDLGWRLQLAHSQTAGRGRNQSKWKAAAGSSLMLSLGGPLLLAPELWPRLSLVAGLALRDALQPLVATELRLKWPNDLLAMTAVGPRKLAGILCERVGGPCADPLWLCGIGINVTACPEPAEVRIPAISLRELAATTADQRLPQLAETCAVAIRAAVDQFVSRGGVLDVVRLEQHLAFRGTAVQVDLGGRDGLRWLRLDGLDPSGELRGRWLDDAGQVDEFAVVSPLSIAATAEYAWTNPSKQGR